MKSSTKITAARRGLAQGAFAALAVAYGAALAGCHPDMWNQPRFTALQENDFFADGAADRLPVENTVPYDGARRRWVDPVYEKLTGSATVPGVLDEVFWTGREGEEFKGGNYFDVDMALLKRGRERFNAICANCHGAGGYGDGLIVQRGFPVPASYHIDRLREVEDGYLVDVIINGFGRMYSHRDRVAAEDRWAIAAYIRALQYSQNVPRADLSEAGQRELEKVLQPEPEAADDTADQDAD